MSISKKNSRVVVLLLSVFLVHWSLLGMESSSSPQQDIFDGTEFIKKNFPEHGWDHIDAELQLDILEGREKIKTLILDFPEEDYFRNKKIELKKNWEGENKKQIESENKIDNLVNKLRKDLESKKWFKTHKFTLDTKGSYDIVYAELKTPEESIETIFPSWKIYVRYLLKKIKQLNGIYAFSNKTTKNLNSVCKKFLKNFENRIESRFYWPNMIYSSNFFDLKIFECLPNLEILYLRNWPTGIFNCDIIEILKNASDSLLEVHITQSRFALGSDLELLENLFKDNGIKIVFYGESGI